ncbi:TolC family protein [Myroides sp. 1354]|uniref:TolC family protein n=1 Tax=unclassified Myroides TaxID=2642485 RepID=UPI002576E617|nr:MULTISPECIES: TolC family protein [unclassified Myroides]MDM1044071.1 TolC family protein [Myroides sp. R163-1]MDM1055006.1 TolC family protein [Myroides sp. 1354]MDM1068303.1 TolC family protein [Myroides sp. 1372]
MNKPIGLFFGLLCMQFSFAQEKWTLHDCMRLAEENSYELMIAQLEKQVVEVQQQSVASYYVPQVGFNTTQSFNYGSAINPMTNARVSSNIQSLQTAVDASIGLFDWSDYVDRQMKKNNTSYAGLQAEEVKYYYQQRVLDLFFKIIGTQEYYKLQTLQLKNSQLNLDRVVKEVEAGAKPQSDQYDIAYIFNNEQLNIQTTLNELSNQKLQLLHLLDVYTVGMTDFELVFERESVGFNSDYEFNPMLEKVRLYQVILETEKKAIKAKNYPRLTGNYQWGTFYSKPFNTSLDWDVASFSKQFGDNKSHYIGVGLSIPVFQGGIVSRQLRKNKAERQLNTWKIKEKEQAIAKEQERLVQEINQVENLNGGLKNSIELAQKSFHTTQVKYENGKADIFSFNAAKNQLLNAEFALIQNEIKRVFLSKKTTLNFTNHL